MLTHLVERMQCGVIITSAAAEPLFLNAYARNLVDDGRGLRIRSGRLEAVETRDARTLRDAVEGCARRDFPGGASFEVSRSGDNTPLIVQVTSHPHASSSVAAATVIVTDPDRPMAVNEPALRRLFGLTRAESALVSLLLEGKTVEQAADVLFVSIHTIRTHLKRVLLKTATGRQSELLRRVIALSILELA